MFLSSQMWHKHVIWRESFASACECDMNVMHRYSLFFQTSDVAGKLHLSVQMWHFFIWCTDMFLFLQIWHKYLIWRENFTWACEILCFWNIASFVWGICLLVTRTFRCVVFMHVCMYASVYVCIRVCMCVYVNICTW